MKIAIAILAIALAGCTPNATPTTQPSSATIVTQAEASLDAAVNGVTMAIQLGVLPKATYWKDIDPYIVSAQAALVAARADVSGNLGKAQTAEDATLAAVASIAPYIAKIQSASTQPKPKK